MERKENNLTKEIFGFIARLKRSFIQTWVLRCCQILPAQFGLYFVFVTYVCALPLLALPMMDEENPLMISEVTSKVFIKTFLKRLATWILFVRTVARGSGQGKELKLEMYRKYVAVTEGTATWPLYPRHQPSFTGCIQMWTADEVTYFTTTSRRSITHWLLQA